MRLNRLMLTLAILAASFLANGCETASPRAPGVEPADTPVAGGPTVVEPGSVRMKPGPNGMPAYQPNIRPAGVHSQPVVRPSAAAAPRPVLATGRFAKPGYQTVEKDGRLWVFEQGGEDLSSFLSGKEPAKHVTMVRAGPAGVTLKAVDQTVLQGYVASRPGFVTRVVDGRIWVFRPGSKSLADFERIGEPAKHVIRPASGPLGMTVKGEDFELVDEYLTARPGFVTRIQDGRLWVFKPGSESLADYDRMGEPAKHVTRVRAGPRGMTIKADSVETIQAYMAAAEGFETDIVDGRIWVFVESSEDWQAYADKGAPAKHITLVRAGPMQMTVKAPDETTAKLYLRQVGQ